MVSEAVFPTTRELLWPTIQALRLSREPMSNDAIERAICGLLALTPEVRSKAHGVGARSEVGYRAAWARTELRKRGFIERIGRASRLIASGENVTDDAVTAVPAPSSSARSPYAMPV